MLTCGRLVLGCLVTWLGHATSQLPEFRGEPERCSLPPDRRPCTDKGTVRFYFNMDTLQCDSFTFRGCPSHGNNFRSRVECLHACLMRPVGQPFDPEGEIEAALGHVPPSEPDFQSMHGAGLPRRPLLGYDRHQQQTADEHQLMAVRRFEDNNFQSTHRQQGALEFDNSMAENALAQADLAPVLSQQVDDFPDIDSEMIEQAPFRHDHGTLPENMEPAIEGSLDEGNYNDDSQYDTDGREPDYPTNIAEEESDSVQQEELGSLPDSSELTADRMLDSVQDALYSSTESPVTDSVGGSGIQSHLSKFPRMEFLQEPPKSFIPTEPQYRGPPVGPTFHPTKSQYRGAAVGPTFPPIDHQYDGTPAGPAFHGQPHTADGHGPAFHGQPHTADVHRPPQPTAGAASVQGPGSASEVDPCLLPPDPGPCRAMLNRWYFNSKQGRCMLLIYGGCHGNENNFISSEECQDICKDIAQAVTPDTPVSSGPIAVQQSKVPSPPAPPPLSMRGSPWAVQPSKVPGPPAPPPLSIQGSPWPGLLHMYSRLLVSTLSRFNNRLRTGLTTPIPNDIINKKDQFTRPPFSSTTEKTGTSKKTEEETNIRLLTTPNSLEGSSEKFPIINEHRSTTGTIVMSRENYQTESADRVSESGEDEDSLPQRQDAPFTGSALVTGGEESLSQRQDAASTGSPLVTDKAQSAEAALPPWVHRTSKPAFTPWGRRDKDNAMRQNRLRKYGYPGKNKGLTLMQIFVHRNEAQRPSAYALSRPHPHPFRTPFSSTPHLTSRFPAASRGWGNADHPSSEMMMYALWRQQQQQQQMLRQSLLAAYQRGQDGSLAGELNLACIQPLDTAYCPVGKPVLRWYYNQKTGRCEKFLFGGCGRGNYNRFPSQSQCQATCMVTSPRPDQVRITEAVTDTTTPEVATESAPVSTTLRDLQPEVEASTIAQGRDKITDDLMQAGQAVFVKSSPVRVDTDVEYAALVAILSVGALALMVLVGLCGLYIVRKLRKTEQPKREKVVEAVLKAHLYGGLHNLPFKMPPPPAPRATDQKDIPRDSIMDLVKH